jgi:adenylate kinase family enzyme
MKRVAVFGNAGAGKSTLARRLASLTGLPLHVLDIVQFPRGGHGGKLSPDEYATLHANLLLQDEWIIDGFGTAASAFERFAAADTLIYIDLPLLVHYWWVSKRLIRGVFANPAGWPENTPVWQSSMDSYRVIWLCHRRLTPRYRQLVANMAAVKRVHHLKSSAEIARFLDAVEREYAPA